ncbi:MAG: hypothetical protein ACP5VE_14285 [Chthonomonadales bacterium]
MVPLHIRDYLLYAPVHLGGTAGLAQLDTGASRSYVYAAFAEAFPKVGSARIGGALGGGSVERCIVPNVEFDGCSFNAIHADVHADDPPAPIEGGAPILMTAGADIL